jgi:DNA invertase Pin-like site-specific DNA recombinase
VQGWTPVGFYEDNDKSASNGQGRPQWERLLTDVTAGRLDAIVVWNQDRGWRKMADLESLRPVLEPHGVLLATTNIGVIDFRNADDVFRAQVSTAMSEMEVAKMKVRMRRAARQKAEQGRPQWRKAFGYLGDTYQPDPITAPLVAQAYAAILAGSSLNDICRLFNGAQAYGLNGRPWTPTTVSLFLRKARNAGLRSHNGEIVGKGTWPGLVEESTWKAAQAVFNAPGRAPGRKSVRQHPLTGVMLCGKPDCDGYLAGNWQMQKHRGGPRAHAICYRCKKCNGVSIRAEHVEPLLHGIVGGRLAMPDAVDLLKADPHDEAEAEAIRVELNALRTELRNIGVERGRRLLTGEQAKIATDLINDEIAKLERRQHDQERLRIFEGIPLGTPEAVDAVKRLSDDRFRAVIDVLATVTVTPVGKSGRVFDPERVDFHWHQPTERTSS